MYKFIVQICLFCLVLIGISSADPGKDVPVYSTDKLETFYQDWLLCGPFPNGSAEHLTDYKHGERCYSFNNDCLMNIGGETKAEPKAGNEITILGSSSYSLRWFYHHSDTAIVKLKELFTPNDNVVAYAFCYIDSQEDKQVIAAIGSNDNVKCWLNGELVHLFTLPDGRWLEADDDYVPVKLKKGRNRLLLKICNGTGDFGLVFRLLDYQKTTAAIRQDIPKHKKLSVVTMEDAIKVTFGTPHRLQVLAPDAKVHFVIENKEKGFVDHFDGKEGFEITYPLSYIPDGYFSVYASFPLPNEEYIKSEVHHFKGKLPRLELHQRLGADLALRDVNGKPYFPIGTYGASPENYKLLKEAGYDYVMGDEASLDPAKEAGLKVGLSLPGDEADWLEHIRATVQRNRTHSALLFWMLYDEPCYNKADLLLIYEAYKLIRKEDPLHPVYLVITNPKVYETFGRCCDILAVDTYPISHGKIESPGDAVQRAYSVSDGDQPVWHCGQLFQWPSDRYPTIQEHRFMSYLTLVSGAKGMLWYSFKYQGPTLPEAQPDLWKAQLQLIREIRELEPTWIFPGLGERLGTGNNAIRAIAKRGPNDSMIVVAVNTSQTETISARIQTPSKENKNISVFYENRKCSVKDGLVCDTFKPLDVHIYQF